jgi:hypothetical protein
MPEWLQLILIIAAVLLVAYLIAVALQVILATLLRRQAQPMRSSIERAQRELASVRAQFDQLAPDITAGTNEMPFGPLYDQARDLLRKGIASAEGLQARVTTIAGQQIAEQPLSSSFMLVPMSKEVAKRLGERSDVKTAEVQLTEVNGALSRIRHILADIEALPARERNAVVQLRSRAAMAARAVDAEIRPMQPMAAERDLLHQADTLIDEATELLHDERPAQPAVIAAYPLRLQAVERLDGLDRAVATLRQRRVDVEAAAGKTVEQLQELQGSIASDESAGLPRPVFRAQWVEFGERAEAAQALAGQGDYDRAANEIATLARDIDAQRSALAEVTHARERITSLVEIVEGNVATVEEWMEQAAPPFELDVTRGALQQLRDIAERLRSMIPSEDAAAMEESTQLGRQAGEVFTRVERVHEDFLSGQRRYAELAAILNDVSVKAEVSKTTQVSSELARANRAYWGELTPEAIAGTADDLANRWQEAGGELTLVRESDLSDVLVRMEAVHSAFAQASELHARAVRALTQLDGDKLQATTALNDDLIARLLDEAAAIGQASPSMSEPSRLIRGRVDELRSELQQAAPDYHTINANAQRLRREAETFIGDYRQRQQHVLSHLGEIAASIRASVADLNSLGRDVRIDFSTHIAPSLQHAHAWLAEFDGVAVPLDSAQVALSEGESIARAADAAAGECMALRQAAGERVATARATLAELSELLSAAQGGLDALADVGSGQWGATMLIGPSTALSEARSQLADFERPGHKLPPSAVSGAIGRVTSAVDLAHDRVTHAHAEIANRVAEIKHKRQQLSQAYELADALAEDHPEFQPEWKALRGRIALLEGRWKYAASYAEALDALTQAVQRTEAFVASARAQA